MHTRTKPIRLGRCGALYVALALLLAPTFTTGQMSLAWQNPSSENTPPFKYPRILTPDYVIADPILEDWTSMSESEVEVFLETHGPDRLPSFLASYRDAGRSAAYMIGEAATTCRINPKVLLALLETRTRLVTAYSVQDEPSPELLSFGLGFGCDRESGSCRQESAGLRNQLLGLACHYRDLLDGEYQKMSDWSRPGDAITLQDGAIHPSNLGTLILYLDFEQTRAPGGAKVGVDDFWDAWVDRLDLGDIQGYSIMDTLDDVGYPFPTGPWFVFQGYDTGTHVGVYRFAFDLVKDSCCNFDTSAAMVAAASGTFYKYDIGGGMGWGVKIVLADGSVVENDHLWPVSGLGNGQIINKGEYIGDIYQGHPGGVNHLHFQVNQGGQPIPLVFGVWNYPDNGPSNHCGCGAHGEWSGTEIGCCGCLPSQCCTSLLLAGGHTPTLTDDDSKDLLFPNIFFTSDAGRCSPNASPSPGRMLSSSLVVPRAPGAFNQNQVLCDNEMCESSHRGSCPVLAFRPARQPHGCRQIRAGGALDLSKPRSPASPEATATPQPLVDTAAPSPPDDLHSVSHRPGVPSNQQRVELNWSAAHDADGSIAGYAITWDQSSGTVPAADLDLAGTATAASSPPLDTGRWYAHMRAVDAAGHASSPVHAGPFCVDVAAPVWPSGMQPVESSWQNGPQPPPISWPSAVDVGSGVAGYRVYYGEDPAGTGEGTVVGPTFTPPVYAGSGEVAVRYLRVAPFDGAGTAGAWATVAVWRYDASRPVGALRVNNGGAVSRSLNVTLHVPAHDTGSGVGSIRFRRDDMDWSDWGPYAPARAWTLASSADPQPVYAQLADRAGNVSPVYTAEVAVDLGASQPASDSYRLARSVVAMGGGVKSSTSYQVRGTGGQTTGVGRLQSAGYQVQSGFWHAAGSALLPPAAPDNLVAAPVSGTAIDLIWQDNASDETGYVIERSPNGTTAWTVAGMAAANATGYSDGGLACASAYFYRVRAYRAGDGQYSDYSNVATATTGACQDGVHIYLPLALRSSASH